MQYSITRCLAELKTLDSRIRNAIDRATFITGAKKSSKKINNVYSREDFDTKVKADYQSAVDLIKRRTLIKELVVESNAKTIVKINGVDMTVAKAIERKDSIDYEKLLLQQMKIQYHAIQASVNRENEKVDAKLQTLLETSFGKEGKQKTSPDEIDAIAKPFKEQNEYEIINPLSLQDLIVELENEIVGFETEVDYVLSTSNSLTQVDIPD